MKNEALDQAFFVHIFGGWLEKSSGSLSYFLKTAWVILEPWVIFTNIKFRRVLLIQNSQILCMKSEIFWKISQIRPFKRRVSNKNLKFASFLEVFALK